jgi:carbon-monoxide dehydrogenase medium subunit
MYVNKVNTHILPRFEYHSPTSLEQALELLSRYGRDAKLLAGGTDLLIAMKERRVEVKHLINIKNVEELNGIEERKNGIRIGAATKHRAIERSELLREKLPLLCEAVRRIGSIQVRNMATVGGNLCNANPCADSATALLALDAQALIKSSSRARTVPLEKFFVGMNQTVLGPDEILVEVVAPCLEKNTGTSFLKIGWTSFDIATVNLAVVLKMERETVDYCRVALGACTPIPVRVHRAEEFMEGKKLTDRTLQEAGSIVQEEIQPRARWRRAPPEYRKATADALLKDALRIASERIGGK